MPDVKVIDAAAWAALPSISLTEGEDLATKGLSDDTYRLIRSDVSSASVTQWTGTGVEASSEVGAPTATVSGGGGSGLISTGLKVQLEPDNTTFGATQWDCEVSGVSMVVVAGMATPSVVSGGTPTGEDYIEFAGGEGLGDADISGEDIPDSSDVRTMYLVARFPDQSANFNGVIYGNNATDAAFGMVINGSEQIQSDTWGSGYAYTGATIDDDTWHVFCLTYDGTNITLYVDDVQRSTGTVTLATTLSKFYINESLAGSPGQFIDVASIHVYDDNHDSTERTQMYDHLDAKYITV